MIQVGLQELVFLLLTVAVWVVLRRITQGRFPWLTAVPICLAIAVLVTPADSASAFIVAAPYALAYSLVASHRARAGRSVLSDGGNDHEDA